MNALRGMYYMVQESLLLSLAHHLSQWSTDSNGLIGPLMRIHNAKLSIGFTTPLEMHS
jgi:hypothetical protein